MPDKKEQTALMQLIEWINEIDNSIFALSASENELKMLKQFKAKATSLLPVEKEQIVDAWANGFGSYMGAEDYFTEKFTK